MNANDVSSHDQRERNSEDAAHDGKPLAYFITFHTYGSWLHGAAPGSVDRTHNRPGTPFLPANRAREQAMREQMKAPAYTLDEAARETVLAAIRARAADRGWRLWAVHVRSNHVHVVVSGEDVPEHIMMNFKAASSRALNEAQRDAPDCKRWSRHGSTRYLFAKSAVEAAIQYTVERQGAPMSVSVDADAPAGRGSLGVDGNS